MWILSQNKELLFECKRVITIEKDEDNDKFLVCGDRGSIDVMILGIYSSETKAKKVLIKIVDQLRNISSWVTYGGLPNNNFVNSSFISEVVFEMPEDDE